MAEIARGKPMRLADALRESIGQMSAHEALKGQRELMEQFGVSLMTVRNALAQLQDEGLIYTVHGVGSFVSDRLISRRLMLTSFTDEMKSRGLIPSSELVSVDVVEAPFNIAEQLRVPAGNDVYKIVRLRKADSEPIALETSFFDPEVFPRLIEQDLSKSLYVILAEKYDREISTADERVSAANVTAREAMLLNCKSGAAALRIERTVFDTRGRVIEVSDSLRRGDRYDIRYVLHA